MGSHQVYFQGSTKNALREENTIIDWRYPMYGIFGPPNWNEETKINDMLEATCAPGSFFRSQGMKFVRQQDHIHPTICFSEQYDSIMWCRLEIRPSHIGSYSLRQHKESAK